MIKLLVSINVFYDRLQYKAPALRIAIMVFLVVVPMSIISNVGRFPWWITTTALLLVVTSFFVRFMWVVIGNDMIKYVEESKSVSSNH